MLDYQKANFKVNKRLVRGLDYYTKVTFEIVSKQLGAQNAVSGGGRYDTLVQELGGKPTPAVGFAIGMERVIEALRKAKSKAKVVVGGAVVTKRYAKEIGADGYAKDGVEAVDIVKAMMGA